MYKNNHVKKLWVLHLVNLQSRKTSLLNMFCTISIESVEHDDK